MIHISRFTCAPLALGMLLHPFHVHAGSRVRNIAHEQISASVIQVGSVDLEKGATTSVQDILRSLPNVLVQETRDQLSQHASFSSLSNPDIDTHYNNIGRATLFSIRAIGADNPALGASALGLLQNRRISIGIGGPQGMEAEVRHDGSALIRDESINIYTLPDHPFDPKLYRPVSYEFFSKLSYQMDLAAHVGYEDGPLESYNDSASYAHSLYSAGYDAKLAQYQRISDTILVMDEIEQNLQIPETASGSAAYIGRSLLRDDTLDDNAKRAAAAYLGGCLEVNRLQVNEDIKQFEYLQTGTELFLSGKFSGSTSFSESLGLGINWKYDLQPAGGEFGHVVIFGGGASFDQTDPNNPVSVGNNTIWQRGIRPDGTTLDADFTVPEVDYISGGFRWQDRLLVAGYSSADTTTYFYGYRDTDADGVVEENTRSELFSSPMMFGNGLQLTHNDGLGELYGFDRGTRNLYQLNSLNGDGFPTGLTHAGGLGDDYRDVFRVGFSKDGNWAAGYLGYDVPLQPNGIHLEARYDIDTSEFLKLRVGYRYSEVELSPAPAETPVDGSLGLRVTFTPNSTFYAKLLDGENEVDLGSAQTDPLGRAIIDFNQALMAGSWIRFTNEDDTDSSPLYKVPAIKDGPQLLDPKLIRNEKFRYSLLYRPDTQLSVSERESLSELPILSTNVLSVSFGSIDEKLNVSGRLSTFIQAEATEIPPATKPDKYQIPFTGEYAFYPGWNDTYHPGAEFSFASANDASNPHLAQPNMSSVVSRLFMFSNPFGNVSLQYRLHQPGYEFLLDSILVLPEIWLAVWPPITRNDLGQPVVNIRCLVINGEYYPVYQFAMRPPDNCLFIHWHSPYFPIVFPLNIDVPGISDPDPPFCGYGAWFELPFQTVEVLLDDWIDFLGDQPPPGFPGF